MPITEPAVSELTLLMDQLERSGTAPDASALQKVSKTLARIFKVDADEVAVLVLDRRAQHLSFVIPQALAVIGSIPLTTPSSLAARTARERRSEVVNNFSSSRHASVFEGVPLGRSPNEIIQKIMSAPILSGTEVAGVAQVSRKGVSAHDAGPDFTQADLRMLGALIPVLHRFVELCKRP